MVEKAEIKYLNNNPDNGIDFSWKEIIKDYKKIVKAKNIYDPTLIPFDHIRYAILMSIRKTGKTNTLLTMALISSWKYGTITAVIRQTEEMIEYRNIKSFFEVQTRNNYISIITGGEYSGVNIKGDYAYFVHYDSNMKIDKRSEPVVYFMAITKLEEYKSNLNLPNCNIIIFDEFVSSKYRYNEFVDFSQILSTLIRDKLNTMIFMLANTISTYNQYFFELCISKEVKKLKPGDNAIIRTKKGTSIYIELINGISPERERLNHLYFGFDNPKLGTITGGDWAVANYPHPDRQERTMITQGIYMKYTDVLLQLDLVTSAELGLHIIAHRANKISEKALTIYTIDDIKERREQFGFGAGRFSKVIWKLYDAHKWYYSDNEIGDIVENYVNQAQTM